MCGKLVLYRHTFIYYEIYIAPFQQWASASWVVHKVYHTI